MKFKPFPYMFATSIYSEGIVVCTDEQKKKCKHGHRETFCCAVMKHELECCATQTLHLYVKYRAFYKLENKIKLAILNTCHFCDEYL